MAVDSVPYTVNTMAEQLHDMRGPGDFGGDEDGHALTIADDL
jgi:hypothetical protein